MPAFSASLSAAPEPLDHAWEHCVGSCHAPLALRADWQRQLKRAHDELGFRHTRFHGLLCDEMGTLVDEMDKPVYSFFNADEIMDYLLSIGMKPFVELSFMPLMLSSGPTIVFHYAANVTPPRDYAAWGALIDRLVRHWVDRYGIEEVATWPFEVWNEPNLQAFWTGTQADYFHLYQVTANAIKAIDPRLQVGGPATARNEWIPDLLDFCAREHVAIDFVSTHHYPTDALGTVNEDTESQLADSDRDILLKDTRTARDQARGLPLYYTEWNASSNPRDHLHDEAFAACMIARTMMQVRGLAQAHSWWTFTDIFEENYMPDTAYQGGFGLVTLEGVPKPSYRAFQMLHALGSKLLPAQGSHPTVDAWVVLGAAEVKVLICNFALPRHPIATETVEITLSDHPPPRDAYIERIDEDHANPKRLWQEMGSPPRPSRRQVKQLEVASALRREPLDYTLDGTTLRLSVPMPPQSLATLTLEWPATQTWT